MSQSAADAFTVGGLARLEKVTMFPVIVLDNLAAAAQAVVTLLAVLAASWSYLFSVRA